MVRIIMYGAAEKFPNYERALRQAGAELGWTADGAVAEEYDALFLAGGGDLAPWRLGAKPGLAASIDEVRDEIELQLLEYFLREGKPVLGVCRGVQMLNAALGGDLHQHIDGHNKVDGTDREHPAATRPGSRMAQLYGAETMVNSAHHQALRKLGSGLQATMWASDGIVEAVEHILLPVWGVQWHPERYAKGNGQAVYDLFVAEVEKILDKG